MAVPHVFGAPDVPVSRVLQMLLLPMLPSCRSAMGATVCRVLLLPCVLLLLWVS